MKVWKYGKFYVAKCVNRSVYYVFCDYEYDTKSHLIYVKKEEVEEVEGIDERLDNNENPYEIFSDYTSFE